MSFKIFRIIFGTVVLIDLLILSLSGLEYLRDFSKPLIVGSIIFFYLLQYFRNTTIGLFLLFALIFSWFGDIALMFESNGEIYFIIGLVSFLAAHICYCVIFTLQRDKNKSPWLFLIITLIYGLFLFYTLSTNLGVLLLPVGIYMLVIMAMLNLAFLRKQTNSNYWLVLVGSICFVLSDSLLAVDKFKVNFYGAAQLIILTYAIAQYLIFIGLIQSFKLKK